MRRLWAPALLLFGTITTDAFDLHSKHAPRVQGKRIENLISGVARAPEKNAETRGIDVAAADAANGIGVGFPGPSVPQNNGVDVGALMKGIELTPGNGQTGKTSSGVIGGNTADQPTKEASSLSNENSPQEQGQILQPGASKPQEQGSRSDQQASGNGQGGVEISALLNSNAPWQSSKGPLSGNSDPNALAGDDANQLADGNALPPDGQGQRKGQAVQAADANGILVEVESTVVVEPNGQDVQTQAIEVVEQEPQAQMPAEAKPSKGQAMPLLMPMPMAEMPSKGQNGTNPSAVIVSAGGATPAGAKPPVITVQAGAGAKGNSSTGSGSQNAKSGAPAAVTVQAGGGGMSNSSMPSGSKGSKSRAPAAVTVQAGSGGSNGSANAASAGKSGAAPVVVIAGGGSKANATSTAKGSAPMAASKSSKAISPVTVVAGAGSTGNAVAAAGQAASCTCKCLCPAGAFPMDPPKPQSFQLGSMEPPATTMSTQASGAVSVSAGGAAPVAASSSSSSSRASSNPAAPSQGGLVAASTTSAASSAKAPVASLALSQATSVTAQSQVQGDAPKKVSGTDVLALPPPPASASLPFDISTVQLQSRVTVNLGRRIAKPTVR